MPKRAIGEDKTVHLGLSLEEHRALRHVAADYGLSVPMTAKSIIQDFLANGPLVQQPVQVESEIVSPETSQEFVASET